MSYASNIWNFTYDANGMRTSRSNAGTTYTYTYNGSQLSRMTYGSIVMRFAYGADGSPLSINYNGTTYYYVTNLQGDVVAILNSSGTPVVYYYYDAWGQLLNTTGTLATTLGLHNPLRYRGYVYDRETGLYYVGSRYYNPNIGRWISADNVDLLGVNGDFVSMNLFAYCGNNPISRKDTNGQFWHVVIGGVIGGIIGGVSAAISGQDGTDVLIGVLAGAAGGALAASGAGVVVQALGSAAISMASNAAQQVNHIVSDTTGNTKFDVGDMLFDGAVGLACGAWGGNGASYGNTGGINAAWKQLGKRLSSGDGIKQATRYFVKSAHRMGGDFVLSALGDSLAKSAVGSAVVTAKSIIKETSLW